MTRRIRGPNANDAARRNRRGQICSRKPGVNKSSQNGVEWVAPAPGAIILCLGALYSSYGHIEQVQAVILGISATASGLLVATGIKMVAAPRVRSLLLGFGGMAFLAVAGVLATRVNPPWMIGLGAAAGLSGIL